MTQVWDLSIGARPLGDGLVRFVVWAPNAQRVSVRLLSPREKTVPMEPGERGYYYAVLDEAPPGSLYKYVLDGSREFPDPASRWQPHGVHGPSAVVDPAFDWDDDSWTGIPLRDYIIYELHVGTYTEEGTFEAIIPHLKELRDLGVTALELMPIAQFPGDRNWGYDGAYPYAAQESYGGPEGLKRLVNACHKQGLAVVLDVVHNHLGPEGSYLQEFAPYFTDRYRNTWGQALNFDGVDSDEVRRYFIDSALAWITDYHVDAFRLDAVDTIIDNSARPFLQDLAEAVHERGRNLDHPIYCIAESALNDIRLIRPPELGGYGLDAQWNDEFHHTLHKLLTGENRGYFGDYGGLSDFVKAFREGYVYTGQHSRYRGKRHGVSSRHTPATQFVVFRQNHDQVGNRVYGSRHSRMVPFEGLKLAASAVLLSPYIPLLFMGEEYGEKAPFLYFVSHSDPKLIEAVRAGRMEEFAAFNWQDEPPDPQDESTFQRAKLDLSLRKRGQHKKLLGFYRQLIKLRGDVPALASMSKERMDVRGFEEENVMFVRRWEEGSQVCFAFNFSLEDATLSLPFPDGVWRKLLDSGDRRWDGPGSDIPDKLRVDGDAVLELPATRAVLFAREEA